MGTWQATAFLAFFNVFIGVSVGQLVVGIGSALADIADENELVTGKRQEGVFFGASAFANKGSAGLGIIVAGILLEAIDWPAGQAVKEVSDVSADTIFWLGITAGPMISLIVFPAVACLRGYDLDRSRLADIQSKLPGGAESEA